MKKRVLFLSTFLLIGSFACAQSSQSLLIDDFEGAISAATVDFGAGGGSNVEVSAAKDIKQEGQQALKITFDAVSGGYMWIARGYELTVKGAGAWKIEPKNIDWKKYNALAFYMYGANTGVSVAVDLIDNGSEYWRYLITDDFSGWKEFVIPFSDFYARGDWQPDNADKNANLDFPLRAFQFEPRPEGKGTIYIDNVRLVNTGK